MLTRWLMLAGVAWLWAGASLAAELAWEKVVLDKKFRSEGVAVADVNRDGKLDVLVGELWYEAPAWTAHEMQPVGDYKDGLNNYSRVFACWAEDLNGDGYPDLIVIDFPGKPAYWLENPRGQSGHWKRHVIWDNACNETPQYVDLLGRGRRGLLMGVQPRGKGESGRQGRMAYLTPKAGEPTAEWEILYISDESVNGKEVPGTFKFAHGLGAADVNGDGRLDVLTTGGWWEQPAVIDPKTPWPFHPANLGEPCADMFALDVDGDGKLDVLATSAHKFGIWWYKQRDANTFEKHDLFPDLVSETHAAHFVDINGDGKKDLVTGKRFWSHGRKEPGADMPARLYWFQAGKAPDGMTTFTPHLIDDDSGVGTQFQIIDVNGDGKLDVVTSNKKGVRILYQK